MSSSPSNQEAVAIVGLAGRFPRAANPAAFWQNLRDGVESVSFFGDDQVQWLPIEHPPRLDDPRYVKARAVLEKPEWFDAAFFGMNPREAAVMDPQHRVFLECAWEALEDAGCNPDTYAGLIGVFAGASMNTYLFTNLLTNPELVKDFGLFSSMIMNDGDFVPTRVSYKLNLRGPSINVQTACSTSLVAVCLAAQSLLTYRCDMALAGGVSITFPANRGQHHLEGGILSSDGHCRTFDASASGTVLGDGAGIVVLKRLSEALADGDRVYAVIKGNALNNDGAVKIGYTAPSVDGQAECIAMAQAEAGVQPEDISYIEAHGTGTPLGDPIEIAGLTKAFGLKPGAPKSCALGSVKSNIGHLDIAAGVAGLIKTVLALQHEAIPPSLHFQRPNPKLELDQTPFVINDRLRPWPRGAKPRLAGVSSFGIGGTNAHVVLEEGPRMEPSDPTTRTQHLLVVSAKTATAAQAAAGKLAAHLEAHPELPLADVAHSLQNRRKAFAYRRACVAGSREAAIAALKATDAATPVVHAEGTPTVAFLFPGQGAQAVNMGRELYDREPRFRATVDRCCAQLTGPLGLDLRDLLFPGRQAAGVAAASVAGGADAATLERCTQLLKQTRLTQPALFVIEYALADWWMHQGVKPNAMIGHSLGEYVAACLAGVFSLEDALAIVAERARLMQAQPEGAMLAVRLPEDRVLPFLDASVSLAATNARGLCVVSGPFDAITALEKKLGDSDVASRRLATSHAFHSAMMEGATRPLAEFIRRFPRKAPQIPFVSNVTGRWITAEQAQDPQYWASHLRQPVRFAEGVSQLMESGAKRILVEVGPGETLAGLTRQCGPGAHVVVTTSLGRAREGASEYASLLAAVGQLWSHGVTLAWPSLYEGEFRQYVPLPTYPFERQRYWIEPGITFNLPGGSGGTAGGSPAKASVAPTESGAAYTDQLLRTAAPASTPSSESSTLTALRALFGELSGMDLTGSPAESSFFQLGFDSLFLTQASQAVSRRFHVDVTFRQLREQLQSFARLAEYLDARTAPASAPVAAAVVAVPAAPAADRVIPLSDAQRELWFASQLGHEVSSAYNESSNVRLRGPLDRAALQRAFQGLIARHEVLRTTIVAGGEQQRIAAAVAGELPVRDFTSLDAAAREARVREFIAGELERPFDLLTGPLFRAHLLRLEPEHHLLVIVVHHIICDGWSLGILQRDLGRLYAAETARPGAATGSAATLAPAPSFVDYVSRQADARTGAAYQAAEAYWLKQFADEVPVLELPADHPRPAERTFAGAFKLHSLPADLTAELKALSARHECTLFTVLLAAFDVLLHRLSGQTDLVVGIPSAAQVMDGMDDLAGHFANLLPVRQQVDPERPFEDFLGEVRARLTEAMEHWRYPFGNLLHRLNIARDSSRMPLANVVFNSTRLRGTLPFGALTGDVEGNAKRFSHFDLNFNFAVTGDTVSIGAYYSTELFDAGTVDRWFRHFERLLRAVVATPRTRIAQLPLLATSELRQILQGWNSATVAYDRHAPIAELFQAQVRRTPDAVAVVTDAERLTYRQLDERAERLARRLRAAGVGADTLVGVFLERTPRLIVTLFGILKAGGAYVPLDPNYPADRLEYIVADAQMPIVVTETKLVAQLPAGGFDFMVVDDESAAASRVGRKLQAPNPAQPTGDSLAYVIYTSGSTGRPKGVALEQRGVTLLVEWARGLYTAEELGGMLFSTSACFDVSVFELFAPLCTGGKIIIAENILQVGQLRCAGEVRSISGVPSAVAELLRMKTLPASVTTVTLAGELAAPALIDALYALPHVRRVFDHYGPTECTVYSSGGLRAPHSPATIGRPLPNEQIYILDTRLQPVPVGVRGEIFIGGDKVARGYLNRSELTAQKFIEVDLGAEVSDVRSGPCRVYRTGDLGRWLPDGTIEMLGRADFQVKVRGFRVELGEIETALSKHPAVAECAVIARQDSSGSNRLLGYVVLRPTAQVDARQLRTHLQQGLPDYMVPSAIMLLDRWPLTPNGKLDRKALPEPERRDDGGDFVAPTSTMEELLADIWRGVLGVARVGIHDNFFELGGHSLLATQVITRVQEAIEVELTMRQFFATPTVAGLAAVLEAALIREIQASESSGAPAASDPCVPAQD